jgi:hypothetical protein
MTDDWQTGLPPELGYYWVQWFYGAEPGLPRLMFCPPYYLQHMASSDCRWSGPLKPPPTKIQEEMNGSHSNTPCSTKAKYQSHMYMVHDKEV